MSPATVYVIRGDHGVKVGLTILPVEVRRADLERAAGVRLDVHATFEFDSRTRAYLVAQVAHWLLRDTRTIGEWFSCSASDAAAVIQRIVDFGVPHEYYRRDAARATGVKG